MNARIEALEKHIPECKARAEKMADGPFKDRFVAGIEGDEGELAHLKATAQPEPSVEELAQQLATAQIRQNEIESRAAEIVKAQT